MKDLCLHDDCAEEATNFITPLLSSDNDDLVIEDDDLIPFCKQHRDQYFKDVFGYVPADPNDD